MEKKHNSFQKANETIFISVTSFRNLNCVLKTLDDPTSVGDVYSLKLRWCIIFLSSFFWVIAFSRRKSSWPISSSVNFRSSGFSYEVSDGRIPLSPVICAVSEQTESQNANVADVLHLQSFGDKKTHPTQERKPPELKWNHSHTATNN